MINCLSCGAPIEFDPSHFPPNWKPEAYCDTCLAVTDKARRQAQSQLLRAQRAVETWDKICPPAFRDTVLEQLPFPKLSQTVLECDLSRGAGVNLWGFPDTGKTRTLFLLLKNAITAGKDIEVFTPGDFVSELTERAYHREPWIRRLFKVDLLAFDDMDKLNLTKEQELVFFSILDKRMSSRLPCVFTHNSTAADLEYKFRNGKPMVRRIRQFTHSFHFPERTLL